MGQTAGYGFRFGEGGGLGAIPFAIRSTDSQPAVFTSIANRDTYYTTTAPSDIAAGTDLARGLEAVGIGPTDGSTVGVTAAFIRNSDNTDWIPIATNFVGPQGPTGPAGAQGAPGTDGARRMFVSETERDTFYNASQTNRDTLDTGSIIEVRIEQGVVALQEWLGDPNPTTYEVNNWDTVSIRTSSASIEFAQKLRIFDFGEFPGFEDMVNNLLALAVGQRFTFAGGSQDARQLSFPGESTLITGNAGTPPTNSPLQTVHTYTVDTTNLITNPAIILQGTIDFVVAPNYYVLEIFQGTDDTGPLIFRERFNPGGTTGVFTARADGTEGRPSPQRFLPNTNYFTRLTGDIAFQYVQVEGGLAPAGTNTGFEITFQDLATQQFVRETLAGFGGNVELTSDVTITSANQSTYERRFLYTPSTQVNDVTVTIDPSIDFQGFSFFVFGSGNNKFTIQGGTGVTIDGEASKEFASGEGGRLIESPEDNNVYVVIYDDVEPVTVPTIIPSLHQFTIDIPSRVDLNTDLNNQRTINYEVTNYAALTALELLTNNGDNKTLTLPTSDGLQTENVTLSNTDTSIPTSITYQLSGTYTGGVAVSNIVTIDVRNATQQEQAYYGPRPSNDFDTVALNDPTLTAVDVNASGTVFIIASTVANGETFGILTPSDRDPVEIFDTVLQRNALADFTLATNVRTESGISYNLRTLVNNSGFSGTFNYRVTTE